MARHSWLEQPTAGVFGRRENTLGEVDDAHVQGAVLLAGELLQASYQERYIDRGAPRSAPKRFLRQDDFPLAVHRR